MSMELLQGVAAAGFLLMWLLVWQIIVRGQRDDRRTRQQDSATIIYRDPGGHHG